jgi:hypothetical protein
MQQLHSSSSIAAAAWQQQHGSSSMAAAAAAAAAAAGCSIKTINNTADIVSNLPCSAVMMLRPRRARPESLAVPSRNRARADSPVANPNPSRARASLAVPIATRARSASVVPNPSRNRARADSLYLHSRLRLRLQVRAHCCRRRCFALQLRLHSRLFLHLHRRFFAATPHALQNKLQQSVCARCSVCNKASARNAVLLIYNNIIHSWKLGFNVGIYLLHSCSMTRPTRLANALVVKSDQLGNSCSRHRRRRNICSKLFCSFIGHPICVNRRSKMLASILVLATAGTSNRIEICGHRLHSYLIRE